MDETKNIVEAEPEWWVPNSIAVTTLVFEDKNYTISTARLSGVDPMLRSYTDFMTALGDSMTGNDDQTDKDYETMLFIDGDSDTYPFGDLPGNDFQGTYQRYDTEEEARTGHLDFVERVKQELNHR